MLQEYDGAVFVLARARQAGGMLASPLGGNEENTPLSILNKLTDDNAYVRLPELLCRR